SEAGDTLAADRGGVARLDLEAGPSLDERRDLRPYAPDRQAHARQQPALVAALVDAVERDLRVGIEGGRTAVEEGQHGAAARARPHARAHADSLAVAGRREGSAAGRLHLHQTS